MNNEQPKCTLSNEQLIEKCRDWVSKLCKSGGEAWTLRVPVDFNYDPDILFNELGNRLAAVTLPNQGEAPERTASQQVPDQGTAAGLQITSLQAEVEQLRSWKAQALASTPDWQAIGGALNLQLGTSVSDQVLPSILNLLKDRRELVLTLRRLQSYCLHYVRAYEKTGRCQEVEALLDQHHHSTVQP